MDGMDHRQRILVDACSRVVGGMVPLDNWSRLPREIWWRGIEHRILAAVSRSYAERDESVVLRLQNHETKARLLVLFHRDLVPEAAFTLTFDRGGHGLHLDERPFSVVLDGVALDDEPGQVAFPGNWRRRYPLPQHPKAPVRP